MRRASSRLRSPRRARPGSARSSSSTAAAATRRRRSPAQHADHVLTAARGRAVQMNAGAAAARGDVLLFLHADTRLPPGFDAAVLGALADPADGRRPLRRAPGPQHAAAGRLVAALMNLRSRLSRHRHRGSGDLRAPRCLRRGRRLRARPPDGGRRSAPARSSGAAASPACARRWRPPRAAGCATARCARSCSCGGCGFCTSAVSRPNGCTGGMRIRGDPVRLIAKASARHAVRGTAHPRTRHAVPYEHRTPEAAGTAVGRLRLGRLPGHRQSPTIWHAGCLSRPNGRATEWASLIQ